VFINQKLKLLLFYTGNKCEMDSASCESEQNAGGKITLAHMGLCESKRDLIQCPDACMALWAPICGSDGKTYREYP